MDTGRRDMAMAAAKTKRKNRATAEEMASRQREISVSEFFAKNRHLLGFDNPRKALLTTVKEAVDNALDACEEAGILPEIQVTLLQVEETRFKVTIRDNGPGIVRKQIDNIFGKLLYGSKFHRMKMSRGQQGIGISAAGMYGLMTTGKPLKIISKIKRKPAHEVTLKIDTSKNRPEVVSDKEVPNADKHFPEGHGTMVTIELEARYQKGKQSVDEYLEQTAIANPHAWFVYVNPANETIEFPRGVDELPDEAKEIKPHPKGIELGTLIQMLERTEPKSVSAFLQDEFSRVGQRKASELVTVAAKKTGKTMTPRTRISTMGHDEAEALYKAIQETTIMAPPTDCLVPIGSRAMLAGLLKEVKAEFFSAATRPPAVYRGNPFQIEVAIAYGGKLSSEESARVLRFANRVPLLYQQSACSSFKAVMETSWKNYGLSQPRNGMPVGPLVVLIHMASVWVPFTSESKEAIADYDEIRKEMKLALQECGRKLGIYLRRRTRMKKEAERRSVFERYIGEIANACESVTGTSAEKIYEALKKQAARKTAEADTQLDEDGKVIDRSSRLDDDEQVIIIEDAIPDIDDEGPQSDLFEGTRLASPSARSKKKTKARKKKKKTTRRTG
ncbi:MAG: DNA topoisomerase VI subunit B [Phycisphaerae bacterium]|nr:DNA topoisomerase VI subunit B [Phycisphaerae bacterium]